MTVEDEQLQTARVRFPATGGELTLAGPSLDHYDDHGGRRRPYAELGGYVRELDDRLIPVQGTAEMHVPGHEPFTVDSADVDVTSWGTRQYYVKISWLTDEPAADEQQLPPSMQLLGKYVDKSVLAGVYGCEHTYAARRILGVMQRVVEPLEDEGRPATPDERAELVALAAELNDVAEDVRRLNEAAKQGLRKPVPVGYVRCDVCDRPGQMFLDSSPFLGAIERATAHVREHHPDADPGEALQFVTDVAFPPSDCDDIPAWIAEYNERNAEIML